MKLNHESLNLSELRNASYDTTPQYGITTQLYEKAVPAFVASELDCLYESLYSSIGQIKGRQHLPDSSIDTYVVRDKGKATVILLVKRRGNIAEVMNEVLTLGQETIAEFAKCIFDAFPSISVISFHAIHTDINRIHYPLQRFNILEDVVLTLPSSEEEYLARLGRSTRRTIKYYKNKLLRSFPSFAYQVYTGEAISKEQILAIISMKMRRMEQKNRAAFIPEEDLNGMWELIVQYGIVGIATIDGKICAGCISYRVGRNDFMNVLAHDPQYDDYRLGTLCSYFAVCDCIARGSAECHFQWGQDDYKFRLLGVTRRLDDVVIYRSFLSMIANPYVVLRAWQKKMERKLRLLVKAMRDGDMHIVSSEKSVVQKAAIS